MFQIPFLLILSQNLAFGRRIPWGLLPHEMGRIAWILLSLAFVFALIRRPKLNFTEQLGSSWALRVGILANAALAIINVVQFRKLGYEFPLAQLAICGLALITIRPNRLWVSGAFSVAFLAAAVFQFPIVDQRSDMLVVIHRALDAWAKGHDPYHPFVLSFGISRMPYLPGTLFSHLPAWLLSLDLRWNEVFYRAIWAGALIATTHRAKSPRFRTLAHWVLLNPYLNFRHDLYFEVLFLLFMTYFLFPRLRWVWIPLLAATIQWAWILMPFLILHELRRDRALLRLALLAIGFSGVILACVALLHSTTSLKSFLEGIFVFQQRLDWASYPGDYGLTFAPIFYLTGMTHLIQPIQALLCAALFAWAWSKPESDPRIIAGLALIGFILLNMHFWLYFYLVPVVWMSFSLQLSERRVQVSS